MDLSDGENNDPFPPEGCGGENEDHDDEDEAVGGSKKKRKKPARKPSGSRTILQRAKRSKSTVEHDDEPEQQEHVQARGSKDKMPHDAEPEKQKMPVEQTVAEQKRCIPTPISGTPTPVGDELPATAGGGALVPADIMGEVGGPHPSFRNDTQIRGML